MDMQESKFKIYSIGIVAETKPEGTDLIKVVPNEVLPMLSGDIGEQETEYRTSAPNAKGVKKNNSVKGDAIIVAKWMPDGNENQTSAPDVVKGETVKIYRFADTDEYYWTTVFREPTLRRLEHVLKSYSNLPSGQTAYDKDSSYWIEISTKQKHIHLHTSKNDGEAVAYDIRLDTRNGSFSIEDSAGNNIILDSIAGVLSANANERIEFTAPTVIINGETIVNGETTMNGNHRTNGKTAISDGLSVEGGGSSLGGGATVDGDINNTGNINSNGNITATGTISGSNI